VRDEQQKATAAAAGTNSGDVPLGPAPCCCCATGGGDVRPMCVAVLAPVCCSLLLLMRPVEMCGEEAEMCGKEAAPGLQPPARNPACGTTPVEERRHRPCLPLGGRRRELRGGVRVGTGEARLRLERRGRRDFCLGFRREVLFYTSWAQRGLFDLESMVRKL
jgi:hypothetical protein